MKRVIPFMICSISFFFLINWSSQETTVDGHNKQAVNFYGILTTHNGKTYEVENIAIGRQYKEIVLFEAPLLNNARTSSNTKRNSLIDSDATNQSQQSDTYTAHTQERVLTNDPKDGITTKIDLGGVSEIRVPNPDIVWSYQKRKGSRKVEYVEITVISNNPMRTENNYLIDVERKMTCDQINPAGLEQKVPFKAIKSLIIKGYRYRDDLDGKKCTLKSTHPSQESSMIHKNDLEDNEDNDAYTEEVIIVVPQDSALDE